MQVKSFSRNYPAFSVHIHFRLALQTFSTLQIIPSLTHLDSWPIAGSKRSIMAVVPARRRGGRVKRRRSGPNVHVQSAGSRYKHTNAIPGPKKAPQIDGRKFSQDSIGFDAGSSGDSASASNTTRASQQGKNSASISKIPYQEDEFPTTPQDLEASEILAHAIVRGFKMRAAKRLPNFLQRRASANNTITGNIIEIKKVLLTSLLSFPAC